MAYSFVDRLPLIVFCAVLAVSVRCTSAERAPIERKLSAGLTDTQLGCLIGEHVPGPSDAHGAIVAFCQIGPDVEQGALALLELADKLHLGDPKTTAKAVVDAVASLRDAGGQ